MWELIRVWRAGLSHSRKVVKNFISPLVHRAEVSYAFDWYFRRAVTVN